METARACGIPVVLLCSVTARCCHERSTRQALGVRDRVNKWEDKPGSSLISALLILQHIAVPRQQLYRIYTLCKPDSTACQTPGQT